MLIWLKSWFPLPGSAPGGGRGSPGRRGSRSGDTSIATRLESSCLPHPSPPSRGSSVQTHDYTPKPGPCPPEPPPPTPHAPTPGLGSLETVVEARGARRGSKGSLSRGR